MFRPDTYRCVKKLGTIGARHEHRNRFAEFRSDDLFIAYVSKRGILDGYGRVTSNPFVDDAPIFGPGVAYPNRCRVAFELDGAEAPVGDLLWALERWKGPEMTLRTHPANMLFCYGGFMEITQTDYDFLVSHLVQEGD